MKNILVILLTLMTTVITLPAFTANHIVTSDVNGEYIKEWLVLGPFFPNDLDKDFLAADVGGEAKIDPKEGDLITIPRGTTLTWKKYSIKGNVINLLDAAGNHNNVTAYAFCILQSEIAGKAEVYLGSDDGVAVWINGKRVHNNPIDRAITLDEDVFEANLKAGSNHCLVKVSQEIWTWGFAMRVKMLQSNRSVLSGIITDELGKPLSNADVCLEQNGSEIVKTFTDTAGNYRINVYPVNGKYDFSATSGELGNWQLGIILHEGEHQKLNLKLKKEICIEGTLLMFDNKTPHVAVPVQAICNWKVIAGVLSDAEGKYRFINLKPGPYQLRCQILNGYVYYGQEEKIVKGQGGNVSRFTQYGDILHIESNKTLSNIDFCFAPFKKGTWKNYTYRDGLSHNSVYAVYQDPNDVIWFGTWGSGVSRYDGKNFVNLTTEDGLIDNNVWVIHRDLDGVMWFGTINGVSRYDGNNFVNFTTKNGLADNWIRCIHQDANGVIWFGTDVGVSRYDGKEFVNYTTKDGLTDNPINAIHDGLNGVIWFGTYGGGISRYDGKNFVNYTTKDGLAGNGIPAVYRDSDGVMWFGTYNNGVSRYDGNNFVNFTTKDGLISNSISDIYQDFDGVMWFGGQGGISRYDGKVFVNFTENGLASSYIKSICQGSDGIMWLGTSGNGVFRYDRKVFVNFAIQDGLAGKWVYDMYQDSDRVFWLGTSGGISRYDGKKFVNLTTKDGLAGNYIYDIHRDSDGIFWFATRGGGVSSYDGKKFVNFTEQDGLANNYVYDIHQDSDEVMWFGTLRGVSQYNGKNFINFTTKDGLVDNTVNAIHEDPDGIMWFGAWRWGPTTGGLSRYDGKKFINFTTKEGLIDNRVNAIYRESDEAIWFGTSGGISCYDGKRFVNYTIEDGLAYNAVSNIYQGRDGIIWFATSQGGVSGYDGTAWTTLDMRDGLISDSVKGLYQDTDGFLWFGTDKGLTRYHRSITHLSVHIVSVQTDKVYTNVETILSVTTGARVTIVYNAIDFKTLPERRQYRCRIKEIDDDWQKPTKSVFFNHTFKKTGKYIFEVQAIDRDLNYSEPATLTLEVKRPWWVYAIIGVIGAIIPLAGAAFYFGKRLQTQRAIAQQFNPYIAGRVVGEDLFYGRSNLITDIERTLANNCFLLYGERRIGKTSLQHQLLQRLSNADDPTYKFIPAYIDLQGIAEDDFSRTIATGIVEHAVSLFKETLPLRLNEDRDRYSYRDLNRDLRTIIDHLKEGETKTIKLVLLMDEIDTLNTYSLRTNLNLRGLFMGQLKGNLVLVMSGLYLKMDWSEEGGGSPPFNFLSREIQIQPLGEAAARQLITEPVKGFYTYEPKAIDLIIELSELRPFTIQGFCLRAVNRVLADGRTRIIVDDIEAIKDSVLAEVASIRGERAGTSLPASFNEALALLSESKSQVLELNSRNEELSSHNAELEAENAQLQKEAV